MRFSQLPSVWLAMLLLLFATSSLAQSDKQKADQLALQAIDLMDAGKISQSIELLHDAQKLDPKNYGLYYEEALAWYMSADYQKAIKILEKHKKHRDVSARHFQLLGNAYDLSGKGEVAMKVYDEGLKKFEGSGMLYLEKGNIHLGKQEYNEALNYYETGIKLDPAFPSNYYRATLLYLQSTDEIYGMLYGEIFMNLERNTKRTSEISELLYKTYQSQINLKELDSNGIEKKTCSFCGNVTMNITMKQLKNPEKIILPFCLIYEPVLLLTLVPEDTINLASLHRIRTSFIEQYYEQDRHKTHPNILFDYQREIISQGHFEAYNHWILMRGEQDGFDVWQSGHKEEWDDFIDWFSENGLAVSEKRHFYRNQYHED